MISSGSWPGSTAARVDQFFVRRPSSFFALAVILLCPSLLSRLCIFHYVLRPVAFELLNDIVRGTGCDENIPDILVALLPYPLGCHVGYRGTNGVKKTTGRPCLEKVEDSCAVEYKADLNIDLLPREKKLAPAGEDRTVFCHPLDDV